MKEESLKLDFDEILEFQKCGYMLKNVCFLRILKIKMTIFRHWCRPLAVRHECWRFCGFVFEFDGGTSTKRWQEAVVLGQQATQQYMS